MGSASRSRHKHAATSKGAGRVTRTAVIRSAYELLLEQNGQSATAGGGLMMTLHTLHAGDGYTYLTGQVAEGDEGRSPGEKLVDDYTASGNPPGRWMGTGAADLNVTGRRVHEDQMHALIGEGMHLDAEQIIARQLAAGQTNDDAVRAAKLGRASRRTDPAATTRTTGRRTARRVRAGTRSAALADVPLQDRGQGSPRPPARSPGTTWCSPRPRASPCCGHATRPPPRERGAVVRLLDNPAQISAVEAGGALCLLAHDVSAIQLSELHRFTDPD